jgi:CO dehydrogenase nickel-insertion accessory protein CooC1
MSKDKLKPILKTMVSNQERLNQYAQEIGVEVFGFIPHDENIAHYDLISKPLLELPGTSPGLSAVHDIVKSFILASVG